MGAAILIVDDEQNVLRAWAKALRYAGFAVVTADTAEKAVEAASEHPFDAVVLDYLIPGTTGIELLVQLRKQIPALPAVIVSGKIDTEMSAAEVAASIKEAVEADAYLHKPVTNAELVEVLKGLVSGKPQDWVDLAQRTVKAREDDGLKAKKKAEELNTKLKKKS